MVINRRKFIESLRIRDKDSNIVFLKLKKGQERLYNAVKEMKQARKPVRIVVLKARQMGVSTFTGGLFYTDTVLESNRKTVVVAHEDQATTNLFEMYKRMHRLMEYKHDEKANNAKALIFDDKEGKGLDSSITCKTASGDGIGASQTINNLHLSEFALWQGDIKKAFVSIMQCVPNSPNSMVIVESTARGFNEFYNLSMMAQRGEGGWKLVFMGWWEDETCVIPYTGFSLTQEEIQLKAKYNLTNNQLEWRRWCIASNCLGDISMFNREYPGCPEDAFIASGDCAFSTTELAKRMKEVSDSSYKFDFSYKTYSQELSLSDVKIEESSKGSISVWEKPKSNIPYVIGCDTSGEGSDFSVAQVIDNMTGVQVAIMRSLHGERRFVEQLYCLGRYFNNALIAIETNFSSYPCSILERMEYENMYVRETVDTFNHKNKKSYGFRTTPNTRPYAIDTLKDTVKDSMHLINDKVTLNEMLTFVKDENGRPSALNGQHDDMVMALAIAYTCRTQQTATFLDKENEEEKNENRLPYWAREDKSNEEGEYISWK